VHHGARSGRRAERPFGFLDAVHGEPAVQEGAADARGRQGHALHRRRRAADPRRDGGPVVLQRGPRAAEDHRGGATPGGGARLRPRLPDGAPQGVRAGEPGARPRARRVRACVLRQLRVGGGGHRAQDRHRLSPGAGRGDAHAADRAGAGLPRRGLRRHLGRRDREQPQVLRHASGRRRPPAAHAYPGQPLGQGPARARRAPGRRTRAAGGAARPRDDRGGDRGAGGGLHRRPDPAEGVSGAAARDHAQARHPVDLRRGHHRLRPAGLALRGGALQRDARHDRLREGDHERGHPDGRGHHHGGVSTTPS
jgi:hypothetical protein